MTRDDYLKELNKAFGDFKFYEEDHHYEYKGQRVGISVTRLIEDYCNEFDSQAVAERVAIRDNKSVQEVLDEWDYKNKFACAKGSTCHEFAQHLWSGNEYEIALFDNSEEFLNACGKIRRQALKFKLDYKDRLEHLAYEYVICSEEYSIASAIDHLFINKLTGGLVLVDYKTNSDIHKNEKYAKDMKVTLNH